MNRELAIRILVGDVIGTTEQTHEAVKMAVEALQDQKTGKWVYNIHDIPICDQCGYMTHEYGNYCPNCGCRMIEQQESEDKE